MPLSSDSTSVWISAILVPPVCLLISILCTVLLYLKLRHRTTTDVSLPSSIPRTPALRSPLRKLHLRNPPSPPPCGQRYHRPEPPSTAFYPFSPVGSRVVSLAPSARLPSPSPSYFSTTISPRGSCVLTGRTSPSLVTPRNRLASTSTTNYTHLATCDHHQHARPPSALFSGEIGIPSDPSWSTNERPTAFSVHSTATASSQASRSAMGTTIGTLGGSHGFRMGRSGGETSGTNQSTTGQPFFSPRSRSSQEHLPPLPSSVDFFHVPASHLSSPAAALLRSPSSPVLHRQDGLGRRSSADVYSLYSFGSVIGHFPFPDGYDLDPSLPLKSPATYPLQNSPSVRSSSSPSHSSSPCGSSSPSCQSQAPSPISFAPRPSALVQRDSTLTLRSSPSFSPRWSGLSYSFRRSKEKAGRRLSRELLPPMRTRRSRSAYYDKEHEGEIELVLSSLKQDRGEERGARWADWMLRPSFGEGGGAIGREELKGRGRANSVGTLESGPAQEGLGNLVLTNPDPMGSPSTRQSHDLVRTAASTTHHSLDLSRTPSSV